MATPRYSQRLRRVVYDDAPATGPAAGPAGIGPPQPPVTAGGGPTLPARISPPLPTDFEGATGKVLSGSFLGENPYVRAGVLDPARREAESTYANQRARLEAEAEIGGAGAFGGDIFQSMMGRTASAHQRNLAEQQNSILAQNYDKERQNMMAALQGQGAFETSGLDREAAQAMATQSSETQLQIAGINASLQRQLQSGQLDFNRQQLALQAMDSLARNDLNEAQFLLSMAGQGFQQELSMMQMMGQMGTAWGGQQLGAFGQVPGLEAAGYTGFGTAFGAEGQVNAADAAAAARRQEIEAQNAQRQWEYMRYNDPQAFQFYLNQIMGIGGAGGTTTTNRTGAGGPNPWLSGLASGAAGFGSLGGFENLFGGGATPGAYVPDPSVGGFLGTPGNPYTGGAPGNPNVTPPGAGGGGFFPGFGGAPPAVNPNAPLGMSPGQQFGDLFRGEPPIDPPLQPGVFSDQG